MAVHTVTSCHYVRIRGRKPAVKAPFSSFGDGGLVRISVIAAPPRSAPSSYPLSFFLFLRGRTRWLPSVG